MPELQDLSGRGRLSISVLTQTGIGSLSALNGATHYYITRTVKEREEKLDWSRLQPLMNQHHSHILLKAALRTEKGALGGYSRLEYSQLSGRK